MRLFFRPILTKQSTIALNRVSFSMKTNTSVLSRPLSGRAHLSPLISRSALAVARRRLTESRSLRPNAVPSADSLTPATPVLRDRFWNPHLIDRLQTPLSRVRE